MMKSSPFARSMAMMAAIAASITSGMSVHLAHEAVGPYQSRGKGEGSSNKRAPGARMANIRAARKTRNVKRHRKACRG